MSGPTTPDSRLACKGIAKLRIALVITALIVIGLAGGAFYAASVTPEVTTVEKVLPNETFPK